MKKIKRLSMRDAKKLHISRLSAACFQRLHVIQPACIDVSSSPGRKISITLLALRVRRMGAVHAPKGGVSIGGKNFKGGEFIPKEVMDGATPKEKAKLSGGDEDKKAKGKENRTVDKILSLKKNKQGAFSKSQEESAREFPKSFRSLVSSVFKYFSLSKWQKTQGPLNEKELQAIKFYTSPSYSRLNRRLRECPETLDCVDEHNKWKLDELQKLASQKLPEPETVYFGLRETTDPSIIENVEKALKNDGAVTFDGMRSTTTTPHVAISYAGWGKGTMFEVRAKTGHYVAPYSQFKPETELMQRHGTHYRVVGKKTRKTLGKNMVVYQLDEIETNE